MTSITLNLDPVKNLQSSSSVQNSEKIGNQQELLARVINVSSKVSPVTTPRTLDETQAVKLTSTPSKLENVTKESPDGLLIASHFPFFGPVAANTQRILLAKQIEKTTDSKELAKLIEKQNQYVIASISSTLITVALAVSAVATLILTGVLALYVGLGIIGAATLAALPITIYDSVRLYQHAQKLKGSEEEVKPEKFMKMQKLVNEGGEKTRNATLAWASSVLIPSLVSGNSNLESIVNFFVLNYHAAKEEADKQNAFKTISNHFPKQFISSCMGEKGVIKNPQIQIGFEKDILKDIQLALDTLVMKSNLLTTTIQEETKRFETTKTLTSFGQEVLSNCVKSHFEKYVQIKKSAVDHLDAIAAEKTKLNELQELISKCINTFIEKNRLDNDNIGFVFQEIQDNLSATIETAKYGRPNILMAHSQLFNDPIYVQKSLVKSSIHFTESNFYDSLNENLFFFEEINGFIKEFRDFGKNIIWQRKTLNEKNPELDENKKIVIDEFPEIYNKFHETSKGFLEKIDDFNQRLDKMESFLTKYFDEKLKGLEEQQNTIIAQTNSLLKTCNELAQTIGETPTEEYTEISLTKV